MIVAKKISKYIVSKCADREEALGFLETIHGSDAEFDVINSQRFADEGWTFWVDVAEEVGRQKKKGKKDE